MIVYIICVLNKENHRSTEFDIYETNTREGIIELTKNKHIQTFVWHVFIQ